MKELEDHVEQNRSEILLKNAQKTTPIEELDGHEMATLEQLQEVQDKFIANVLLHVFFLIILFIRIYMCIIQNIDTV